MLYSSRRKFLKTCGTLSLGLMFCREQQHTTEQNRPNILLVLTDDQGYGDIHIHGNDIIDTPNLDGLAEESARFERFYVSSVCAPARASLLTGRYHLRTNTRGVLPMYLATMREEEKTLAESLKQAGYSTSIFGKWHLGSNYPYHPSRQGFSEYLGFRGGAFPEYFDPILERRGSSAPQLANFSSVKSDAPFLKRFGEQLGEVVQTKGYITDVLTNCAIDFIERNQSRPFFCYLDYNAPHTPIQVPDRFFDKYKERGLDDYVAGIYGMVESIDENIGKLLGTLDELRLTENTIVIFLSDNGANWGDRYNSGMRGYKGSVDEGGMRVPLFVRWPGNIQAGQYWQHTAHIDVMPTILDICKIKEPDIEFDGKSFYPLLQNDKHDWPDRMLYQVRMHDAEDEPLQFSSGAVRTNKWRFTIYKDHHELYDMENDFGQKFNVIHKYPNLEKKFAHAFWAWYEDVTKDGLERPPIQIGHEFDKSVSLTSRMAYLQGAATSQSGTKPWHRDWIHHINSAQDYAWWDVDVIKSGRYDISMVYSCDKIQGADKIIVEVSGNGKVCRSKLHGKPDGLPPKKNHNRVDEGLAQVDNITTQELGFLTLKIGRTRIDLKAFKVHDYQNFLVQKLILTKK